MVKNYYQRKQKSEWIRLGSVADEKKRRGEKRPDPPVIIYQRNDSVIPYLETVHLPECFFD